MLLSNIDRLLAIWQQLHPNEWFDSNDPRNGDTPLQPFHTDSSNNIWTSNRCQFTKDLNYTYENLEEPSQPAKSDISDVTGSENLAKLRKRINLLYGTTRQALQKNKEKTEGNKNDYVINIVYDRYRIQSYLGHVRY